MFYCYMLLCSDGSYYVGVSNDPARQPTGQQDPDDDSQNVPRGVQTQVDLGLRIAI
jgi:hypothetical protein